MLDANFFNSIILTGKIIMIVTLPLLIFSLIIAYFLLLNNKIINHIIEILINLPIIFPPIGIGFLLVYGLSKNSYLGQKLHIDLIFSFTGIIIAAFLTGIPFICRAIMAGNQNYVKNLCDVSYTLGRGRVNTFLTVVIPLLKNSILQGLILAIGRIIGEVGITMLVGGNIEGKTTTISLEIYNSIIDGEEQQALILALILFIFSFILFYLIHLIGKKITA